VIEHNPALSVKAPRQKLGKGKTAVLTAEEAGELLRSIETDSVVGLRDRALIGVMVFTFARISAACGLNVGDIFHQQRRLWLRLHENGGKFHEMPCHHMLEGYLSEYIERARLGEARVPALPGLKHRPYGRGQAELTGVRLDRINAWKMVRRRAKAAGLTTDVCNLPSAAPGSPPTWRTAARWRRRARWRRTPSPEPPSSTTGARIASRSTRS
jgi:integrase/recombinase XerD